ncbi:MAG: radical SAM protein [Myxococcota bacterium]
MKAILHLTPACNLACNYCYAAKELEQKMSLETAKKAVDFVFKHGQNSACISFFGGEPLLRWDLIKKTTFYAEQKSKETGKPIFFRMSTNGILFDEDILKFCRKHKILFAISLDGNQQAHDKHRITTDNQGTWQIIDEKLDLILKYNPHTVVGSVISPDTIKELPASLEYMWERGIRYLAHSPDFTNPRWTPELLDELENSYRQMAQFYLARSKENKFFFFTLFDEKIKYHARGGLKPGDVCDFGVKKISVAPDGNIFPCVRFVSDEPDAKKYLIGNVYKGFNPKRQRLINKNRQPRPQCIQCDFNGRCSNYCGCTNWQTTGDILKVSPLLCAHERMLIPIADEIGKILWQEKNKAFLAKHYDIDENHFPLINSYDID